MLNYKFLEKSKLDLELTFLMGLKLESNFKSKFLLTKPNLELELGHTTFIANSNFLDNFL
jgi:hypothetical protein